MMSDPSPSGLVTIRGPGFGHVTSSALLVTIAGVLPVFLTGGLSVQIRETISASAAGYGAAISAFFLISAAFSIAMGRMVQRLGPRRGQEIACVLAGVSLLVVAAFADSLLMLGLALAIGGIGYSVSQVSTNFSLAQLVEERRRGIAFGIKQSGVPAATLLGGISVPLIGLSIGWRWAFALGAAVALLAILTIPKRVEHLGVGGVASRLTRVETRPLVLLAIAAGFGSAAGNALGAFFVAFASTHVSEAAAGLGYAAGGLVCLLARVSVGWGADRLSSGRLLVVATMFALGCFGYLLFATQRAGLILPAALLTFGAGWGWPGLLNFAVVLTNIRAPAAATGVTQTGAFFGGVAGPLAFGLAVDHLSYSIAWSGAAASAMMAALFCLAARRVVLRNIASRPAPQAS